MFVPTRCCMPGPVDEEQWNGVRFVYTPLVDYLKHVGQRWADLSPPRRWAGGRPQVASRGFAVSAGRAGMRTSAAAAVGLPVSLAVCSPLHRVKLFLSDGDVPHIHSVVVG